MDADFEKCFRGKIGKLRGGVGKKRGGEKRGVGMGSMIDRDETLTPPPFRLPT
jgi:hypothetical protein